MIKECKIKTTTGNLVPVSINSGSLGAKIAIIASDNKSVHEWLYRYLKPYEVKGYDFYPVEDEGLFSEYAGKNQTKMIFVEDIFFGKKTIGKLDYYRRQYPKIRIIVFSVSHSPTKEAGRYLRWSDGYFISLRETEREIRITLENILLDRYEIPFYIKASLDEYDHLPDIDPHLTHREIEIVRCIVNCRTDKEIAGDLMLSERTVQNHKSNIYFKFGIRNMVGVLKLAVSKGIIPVEELMTITV